MNNLLLERYLVDDVSDEERAAVDADIARDEAVSAYIQTRRAAQRDFAARIPVLAHDVREKIRVQGRKEKSRPFSHWLRWLVPAASACAVALFVLLQPGEIRPRGDGGDNADGLMEVVVRRGDHTFVWNPGIPLRPGDALRLLWQGRDRVSVVLLDAQGKTSPLYDRAAPGADGALAGSLVLDDAVGAEELLIAWGAKPIAAAELAQAVEQSKGKPPALAGVQVVRLSWQKEPLP